MSQQPFRCSNGNAVFGAPQGRGVSVSLETGRPRPAPYIFIGSGEPEKLIWHSLKNTASFREPDSALAMSPHGATAVAQCGSHFILTLFSPYSQTTWRP